MVIYFLIKKKYLQEFDVQLVETIVDNVINKAKNVQNVWKVIKFIKEIVYYVINKFAHAQNILSH